MCVRSTWDALAYARTLPARERIPHWCQRSPVDREQLERVMGERLDALGPAPRAELLHVLMLPDFKRVGMIQSYWGNRATRTSASC